MVCALCDGNRMANVEVWGLKICNICMENLSSIPVATKQYDSYKDAIKIALKNYIHEKMEMNPVK